MKHPPPPDDEKKKRPFAAPTAGPLQTDKISELPPQPGDQATCPPFILSQLTQYDNVSPFLLDGSVVNVIETSDSDYTPLDSHGQIELNISTMTLAELDAEIERERARFRKADKSDNDTGFLYSFLRLLCLYEWHSLKRWEVAR